jgi:hypothetical protein
LEFLGWDEPELSLGVARKATSALQTAFLKSSPGSSLDFELQLISQKFESPAFLFTTFRA